MNVMAKMDIKTSSGGGGVFTPKTDHRTDLDSLCSELCKISNNKILMLFITHQQAHSKYY